MYSPIHIFAEEVPWRKEEQHVKVTLTYPSFSAPPQPIEFRIKCCVMLMASKIPFRHVAEGCVVVSVSLGSIEL